MEEKKRNQEMELTDLQKQYKGLQEKFKEQEIVGGGLIHEMLHTKLMDLRRRNVEIVLTYGLLAAAVCWSWHCFGLSWGFMAVSMLLFLFLGLFELLSSKKVRSINAADADIKTLTRRMRDAQIRFSLVWSTEAFALCLWTMWFVIELGPKLETDSLRDSFFIVAVIITIAIILAITSLNRLAKMGDELAALTARLDDSKGAKRATYRGGKAYWSGIVMVALSLVGLIFKLMHWPFGSLIMMAAVATGLVFVLQTGKHLELLVPEERGVIRIAKIAGMLLVVNAAFMLFHWPFGGFFGLLSLALIAAAILLHSLKKRRR